VKFLYSQLFIDQIVEDFRTQYYRMK